LIGAFGGLLVGLALALTREQLDRRVRHSKGLEDAFGLPVLASVPKSRALSTQNGRALEQLPAKEAEAFQILRANLHYLNTDRELRSVVVTSTGIGDGKSTIALNLAKADARVGKKVLLVEGDIRRPRLGKSLGLETSEGLTAFLSDHDRSLASVSHRIPVGPSKNGPSGSSQTLDVVVSGQVPENPSGLIDSDRMRDLIREGEANYDLVVIDTAPAAMVADAIPLMSEATAVVVVGRVGKITSGEADALREQLERIDAPAFGLVANFTGGQGGKYGYGYY
jgi:succinoglycan biosynthesis transport protein ExoP